MKRAPIIAALALAAPFALGQSGMQGMDKKDMPMKGGAMQGQQQNKAQAHGHNAKGVVTKVDPANAKVSIKHEPVASLNWPAMTMAFKVQDKKMLDKLAVGSKVDFEFEHRGKDYVITKVR